MVKGNRVNLAKSKTRRYSYESQCAMVAIGDSMYTSDGEDPHLRW